MNETNTSLTTETPNWFMEKVWDVFTPKPNNSYTIKTATSFIDSINKNNTPTNNIIATSEILVSTSTTTDLPVKKLFKTAILDILKTTRLPLIQNIAETKEPSTNSATALCAILAITALQHAIIQCSYPLYTRISNHISTGSLTGSFVSWAFNQNPYLGALIGIVTSIPIGMGFDYLQNNRGTPTLNKVKKVANKLLFGGRIFLEFTLASSIGLFSWNNSPSLSKNLYIDHSIKLAISTFSSLASLSLLEFLSSSKDLTPSTSSDMESTKKTNTSPTITLSRYIAQTLLISYLLVNLSTFSSLLDGREP